MQEPYSKSRRKRALKVLVYKLCLSSMASLFTHHGIFLNLVFNVIINKEKILTYSLNLTIHLDIVQRQF